MKIDWRLLAGVATMTGMIMGAGFLGMPYIIAKSGFLFGLIQIVLIGFALLAMNLYLGEVLLRTKRTHQIPGLANIYLGKTGGKIMFYSTLFSVYLASVAYLLGQGESMSYLFFGTAQYTLYFASGFWMFMSYFVYKGIRTLKKGESIGLILVLFILILICVLFAGDINYENLAYYDFKSIFLPFGVIMFAFFGFSAIPEALRVLRRNEKKMKKAIIIATLIPILVYSVFTLIVIGVNGKNTPQIATLALGKPFILLGILTMFTAYFCLTMALRDIYRFDRNYSKFKSWFLACFLPFSFFLVIHFFKIASFIDIIGFTGAVFTTLIGVMILLMVKKARVYGDRNPEYELKLPPWIVGVLMAVLIIGMVCELVF